MKLICGWCLKVLRDGTLPASHGMCPACANRFEHEQRPADRGDPR